MNWLILSTLPHLLSIAALFPYYGVVPLLTDYVHIILCSTALSVSYHATGEAVPWIVVLDYGVAFVWFFYDVYLGLLYTSFWDFGRIIGMNAFSMLINVCIPHNHTYAVYHSLWHLLNAAKSYKVATLLSAPTGVVPFSA